ncbi:CoB--CoM heterodisulfide reductase iron-sulfur subunit A family protein [Geomesophilobacter sediminis]|uniref:CoB--CoM heterodisulfide reductase iron-sulfur subunit A family protein n=1 Tax=Geomesophilobacter sediminis TaxID=2798584 RepID=A0A8J7J1C2_9BACT|nr:CoB--CoM heterodisulfide reductase iron-sulfur subunit A family protein [Geomesophilobacter sediminis]MBJ6724468.1 CoB--CoM heterodisulfide reductase iron-sulfur subunit A family protein [Geomesophilobacter sediminis]
MKTGVYFCNCGSNIAEKVDPERLREALERSGAEMAWFRTHPFLCSEEGKQFLEQELREEMPDRVVLAACSPREHEGTFRRVLAEAGMNPYLMQMVNLREQIAWVTADPEQAVAKAAAAVNGALRRVALHEPLEKSELEAAPEVLVVGAGPAGLKAALTLADAGRRVTLVEKSPVIGGLPVRYEELFPNLECGPCLLEPVMGELLHGDKAELVEILTLSEVSEVAGSFGNFLVKIRRRPRYVDPVQCIGCGECAAACPATLPNPYNGGMDERNAIDFAFTGGLPSVPYLDPSACTRFTAGSDCEACRAACPMGPELVVFEEQEEIVERRVGAVVLATGATLYDCSGFPNLGYGSCPDVKDALEFERLIASTGPTGGEVLTSAGKAPASVAIVHCVGSLDDAHRPYCSGICCSYAFKFNKILQERLPEAKIHHLYRQLVAPGKEEFRLQNSAREYAGAQFHRYDRLAELEVVVDGGQKLRLAGGELVDAELVVLCPALVPNPDAEKLAALLDLPLDGFGFFEELNGRIDATRSKLRGVYLAGTCQGPTDIRGAATQGAGACGALLSELVEGRTIELDPCIASVDAERCAGCRVCARVCPFRAIGFDAEQGTSEVNPVLCRGCGTCVAACPMKAIRGNHFTDAMIEAELEGVLA